MAGNFSEFQWQYRYCSSALNRAGQPTDVLHDFYIPALQRAVRYDRVAGFFRSTSLAAASQGYTAFLRHGGRMRLIVGADLQIQDVAAILQGNNQRLSDRLMEELAEPDTWPEEVKNGVSLLGEMVSAGKLEVRVAFRVHGRTGNAISIDSIEDGYVHEKWFIMSDADNHRLYGNGSLNESRTALSINAENVDIHCDWLGSTDNARTEEAAKDFERLWENQNPHMRVLPVPDAVRARLIRLKDLKDRPTEIDGTVIDTAVELSPEERLKFAVLHDAPHMPGGEYIGMYSAPVSPWPHQEIVSRRLIESWPYSYMMCDEVGLGKTIEAALAIRSLVLSGQVKRVLIVAPASLTEQWHRELAEKAMLSFALSRVKPGGTGKYSHSYIYPDKSQTADDSLYGPDLNIVSSGLVRLKKRQGQLNSAEDFDIVLVDEAHYARRKNPRDGASGSPNYGDLYIALHDKLRPKAKSMWLATATPMQIDPIEVYDLFRLTNRVGQFQSDPALATAYFQGLGMIVRKKQPDRQKWAMMGQSFLQIEKLDPYLWEHLSKTVITSKNRKALNALPLKDPPTADLRYLSQPLFAGSPLSRVMMRHTRALLELYRDNGQLKSNLAHRHVRPVLAIEFTPAEAAFYEMLEDYCKGLGEQIRKYNQETKQVMFFLLNFLQLRFASSFYAIQKTLERRLLRVRNTLMVGSPETDEELQEILDNLKNEDDDYSEGDLDEITVDMLLKNRSSEDLRWEESRLSSMLKRLDSIQETPSKMRALLKELDQRREPDGRLRQTVLFTRFFDTLASIRNYLRMVEPSLRIGIYAGGDKASWYDPKQHKDSSASHEAIKALFLSGEIDLLLCTDAAAEGLNLQTADLLINFDLGWNPMKIEQRIGRIDRIGQKYADIEVVNMCYVGSTEQIVYGRLLDRLQQANLIVGTQQISMLPVTQEEFRKLHTGELSAEKLEKESIKRLKKQKEDNACMEMSAEDMYQMYSRMSEQMRSMQYPATNDDLWTCLTTSEYLKSNGASLRSEGNWTLPATELWGSMNGTNKQESASAVNPYICWGNIETDYLLSVLGGKSAEMPYIRHIELPGVRNSSAVAVSTSAGVKLITAFDQIAGLHIDPNHPISETDIVQCKKELKALTEKSIKRQAVSQDAEKANIEIAELHNRFVALLAAKILKDLENNGMEKATDAIKQLEIRKKEFFPVSFPAGIFSGRASDLLFATSESGGMVNVTVYGVLLECVTERISREFDAIRGKNQDKKTIDIIRRLERR